MTIEGPRRIPLSRREIFSFMASFYRATRRHLQAECAITNLTGEVMDHPPHGGN